MKFHPYGPFDIATKPTGSINDSKESLSDFWEMVNANQTNLSEAVGCYIFSIQSRRGSLPWYVGLAEKQSFREECFANHKLLVYMRSLDGRQGSPQLTFLPKFTMTGKYAKCGKNAKMDVRFLENLLIGLAIQRNPKLANIKKTKLLKDMIVPGVLNTPQGRQVKSVYAMKRLLGA